MEDNQNSEFDLDLNKGKDVQGNMFDGLDSMKENIKTSEKGPEDFLSSAKDIFANTKDKKSGPDYSGLFGDNKKDADSNPFESDLNSFNALKDTIGSHSDKDKIAGDFNLNLDEAKKNKNQKSSESSSHHHHHHSHEEQKKESENVIDKKEDNKNDIVDDFKKREAEKKEEEQRLEREAAEKKAKEEKEAAQRKAEEERKAKEEREAAERKAKEEREAAEKKAREEKEAAEKKAREEKEAAEKKAREEKEAAIQKAKKERERKKQEKAKEKEKKKQDKEALKAQKEKDKQKQKEEQAAAVAAAASLKDDSKKPQSDSQNKEQGNTNKKKEGKKSSKKDVLIPLSAIKGEVPTEEAAPEFSIVDKVGPKKKEEKKKDKKENKPAEENKENKSDGKEKTSGGFKVIDMASAAAIGSGIAMGQGDDNIDSDAEENADAAENANEKAPKLRKTRQQLRKKYTYIGLAALIAACIIAAGTFGIVKLIQANRYDKTAQFYFASDLLTEEGKEYTVYENIEFSVQNYVDSLRTSVDTVDEYDIKVTCEDKNITSSCKIKKDIEKLPANKQTTGKVKIKIPKKCYNKKIEVSVTSDPNNVELLGTFTVLPTWDYTYVDSEEDVAGCLTLVANDEVTLKVSWDSEKLFADSTNAYVKASKEKNVCYVTLAAGASAQLYFFKSDPTKVYDVNDRKFPITIEKTDLVPAALITTKADEVKPEPTQTTSEVTVVTTSEGVH